PEPRQGVYARAAAAEGVGVSVLRRLAHRGHPHPPRAGQARRGGRRADRDRAQRRLQDEGRGETVTPNPRLLGPACFACGTAHDARALQGVCVRCGLPLRVDYRLDAGAARGRTGSSLWRYRDVLPLVSGEVSLVEGWTPLLPVGDGIWIKDESRNPTGSFKARGMSVAVSMAAALGARALCAPSAGNAAGAPAPYGPAPRVPPVAPLPRGTPRPVVAACPPF